MPSITSKIKQKGAALLFSCMALLLIVSLVTAYATNAVISEQKVLTNNYRAAIAFAAAEAGIEYGLAHFRQNKTAIMVNRGSNKIDGYTFTSSYPTLANGATFTITYTSPIANNYTVVKITSIGRTSDNSAQRTLSQIIKAKAMPTPAVTHPLMVRNTASLGGSSEVINNSTGTSINSGNATSLTGSAETQTSVNGITPLSSDKNTLKTDVKPNDATLTAGTGDDFFTRALGAPRSTVQANANVLLSNSSSNNYSSSLNGLTNKVIWVNQSGGTASLNSHTTIGSASAPVILIFNLSNGANLSINGGTTIYGLVYVAGNWTNGGGGNSEINGELVVEGNFSTTGGLTITYDPTAMSSLNNLANFYKTAGGWDDIDP